MRCGATRACSMSRTCARSTCAARASGRLLLRLLANDVGRLKAPGKALYSCMLRPDGGVIDDLIAYFLEERWFRLVVNAGTADKDLAWIKEHAKPVGVAVVPRRDLAMIAVQGPQARAKASAVLPEACARAGSSARTVLRCLLRRVVRRAHRLHRRRRLRDRAPLGIRTGVLAGLAGRRASCPAASARATRSGSKPA